MKWGFIIGLLFVSLFLVSCVGVASVETVSVDYPTEYNVINYGREMTFTLILKNTGNRNCVLTEARSTSFWNPIDPGLTGRYIEKLNEPIIAGETAVITLHPYLRDGDIIQSWEKEFSIELFVNEGCTIDSNRIEGKVYIDIENSLLEDDLSNDPVMIETY